MASKKKPASAKAAVTRSRARAAADPGADDPDAAVTAAVTDDEPAPAEPDVAAEAPEAPEVAEAAEATEAVDAAEDPAADDEASDDDLDDELGGDFDEAPRPAPAPRPPAPRPIRPMGPPTRSTQALEHGAAASAAKQVKPGFAINKATDLAFALGFPYLEYIVDDHPDDARSEMIAYERRSYRLGWPRNIAIRWCRITASKGFKRTPQGATELDGAGKKALKNGTPLVVEEVALTLKSMFSDTSSYEDLQELVRLYEAFMGPELVATSIVDALEKSSNNVWNHQDHDRAQALRHVGFTLMRLPAGMADKLRARLAAIFDRRVKALPTKELGPRKGERGSLLRALDLVLNGRAGVERSAERNEDTIEPTELIHLASDAAFVCEAARQRVSTDPRMVFLGGDAVLDRMLEVFPRFRGQHHQLLDGFSELASPKAVELLQRIAKGKEAAERAQAVLAARGL